ncbi:MAG: pyridoxine 5'-phosphate synthase [Chitinophagales bacterium]|jgi:pyridoxine 5-phosphate synthase|nr:pyridoxine 5'-phosphate synthase [Chitinophagales bacterium]
MATRLSVNINKIATLRNARGGNLPDVIKVALDCERFGAEGITVHPRPDERHIKYSDVVELKKAVNTEFNIEGYPDERFIELVLKLKPAQVTLVPDEPNVLTSNEGWDTIKNQSFLSSVVTDLRAAGIRVSLFLNPVMEFVEGAKAVNVQRIELFTGRYAALYPENEEKSIEPYVAAADFASEIGLEINAGHDLNLQNLKFFKQHIPALKEVSIGHSLICDALYYGLENTIQLYRRQLSD